MTPPPDAALALEQRDVARGAALAAIVSLLVLALAWLTGDPWMPPLDDPMERLSLAVRLDLAVMLCLGLAIGRVANQRFGSAEDIGGSASASESVRVRTSRAILQNTLEQAVLAVPVHLALALALPPARTGVLAALILLFLAGRIAFARGYARGAARRAFGFWADLLSQRCRIAGGWRARADHISPAWAFWTGRIRRSPQYLAGAGALGRRSTATMRQRKQGADRAFVR